MVSFERENSHWNIREDAQQLSTAINENDAITAVEVFDRYIAAEPNVLRQLVSTAIPSATNINVASLIDPMTPVYRRLLGCGLASNFFCQDSDHVLACIMNNHSRIGVGSLLIFQLFLEFGADPNAIALGGGTLPVLHYAIQEKRNEFIEPLIRYGASIWGKSELGYDALQFARRTRNDEATAIILSSRS